METRVNINNTHMTAALLLMAIGTSATAAAPAVPGAAQPGQIEKQFREAPQPRAGQAPMVEPAPPAQTAPGKAEEIHFGLRQIKKEGATVYTDAQLQPLFAELVGKDISLARIFTLADQLSARYRIDG